MTDATDRRLRLTEDEAARLLPWLLTDRLDRAERDAVLDHMKECGACRDELRFLSDLERAVTLRDEGAPSPEPGVRRVLARIEARERPGRRLWRRASPLVAFAALVALALAGIFVVPEAVGPAAPSDPSFRTLADPETALAAGPHLRLVLDPATPERELRRIVRSVGAVVTGGPSERGVYTLALPSGSPTDRALAALRAETAVLLAEPAAGSGR